MPLQSERRTFSKRNSGDTKMKCTAFIALILLLLTVSCTQMPTAAPRAAFLTATPQTATKIPTLTDTPTATYTLAATSTATPTQTSTPTPTTMPTPIAVPMPPLGVSGNKFVAGGKEVVLRGAVFPHFSFQQSTDKPAFFFAFFKRDIDTLKQMGANFANIEWNSGFLDNPAYVENLVEGLEYAKSRGFWTELSLTSRGRSLSDTSQGLQITVADDQILTDWNKLLNDTNVANRIANNVDIFGAISELEKNSRGEYVRWSEAKDLEKRVILLIRQKTNKKSAIGAFTGPRSAGDARGALSDPPDLDNVAIEVHPYQWIDKVADFKAFAQALRAKGILVFVGEMGFGDSVDFIEEQYKFLTANGMSFAVYAIISESENQNLIVNKFAVTERGKLAEKYFRVGQ
jgi:hypothetical protein